MDPKPWLLRYDAQVPPSLAPYPAQAFFVFLERAAARYPDRPCTIFGDDAITYREMNALTDRMAAALAGLGVRKGDRVGLILPNAPQFVVAYYGTLKAGAVVVAANPQSPLPELRHPLSDAGVEIAIVWSGVYEALASLRAETAIRSMIVTDLADRLTPVVTRLPVDGSPTIVLQSGDVWLSEELARYRPEDRPAVAVTGDDPAILQYSGGTTGVPKGAIALHRNLVANTVQNAAWIHVLPEGEGANLVAIPLFHVYGMISGMALAISKACAVILVFNPRDLVSMLVAIERHKPQLFPAVPALFNAISRHPDVVSGKYSLRSIRVCVSGSAPFLAEHKARVEQVTGGTLVEGFGMSETPSATHCNPLAGVSKTGSIGLPYPDVEVRLVSLEDGVTEVAPGEEGEMVLRGPQVFAGYWNMPQETALTLRPDPIGQGGPWLYTGDIARMDAEGYFYIVDRKKELIKSGGFQVWPREVEEVLTQHPSVREAAVAGVPDDDGIDRIEAWVVLQAGAQASADELRQFARTHLSGYKVPRHVSFRAELPRTTLGKLLRRRLIAEALEQRRVSLPSAS